ncbi:unnamed protein product [Closterium sp. NIES-53]
MIHAAAPHFLWPFAVQYAAHQINLQPRVSLPETTPTLRWTGKVGNASAFRVWGSRAFVRDTTADKLSSCAVPCVFLGSPPDAPGWQFYHRTSRRVLSSQDVTFDDVSQVDPAEPVEVAVDSGAARGAEPAGAGTGGAEPERVEPGGADSRGVVSWGAESVCAESGGSPGVPLRRKPLSAQWLRECYARRCRHASSANGARAAGPRGVSTGGTGAAGAIGGAAGAGAAGGAAGAGAVEGAAGAGAARGAAGAGATGGTAGARATGGAAGAGAAGGTTGAGAAGGGTGAVSSVCGGAVQPRPYYVPLLQQVLSLPPSPGPTPPLLSPPPVQGLTERRDPESRPVSPVSHDASPFRTARAGRVLRPRPPPVPGTHSMTLHPSTAPQRVPLPSPPASSLPDGPDPKSDSLLLCPSALVAELVDFALACPLDNTTSLVAEFASASVYPPSVGVECAPGTDVLEDRQEEFECFAAAVPHLESMPLAPEGDPDAPDIPTPRSYAEAIEGPYSSQWQAAMDAKMASWKSTGTYVDEIPPPGANIVSGMWIFRVRQPLGSPPFFKVRYITRGFSKRQGVDFFQTFSPTPKMTTLWVLLHVAAQGDYKLHSLDFSTAFLQGSLHKEIWLHRPPGFTGLFPAGTQTTLATHGFATSTADPSLFLRTNTTLPPFYVLVYVDNLVFATANTEALAHVKSELQKRHACTDLGELTSYLGLRITRDRAQCTITLTQSHMV